MILCLKSTKMCSTKSNPPTLLLTENPIGNTYSHSDKYCLFKLERCFYNIGETGRNSFLHQKEKPHEGRNISLYSLLLFLSALNHTWHKKLLHKYLLD